MHPMAKFHGFSRSTRSPGKWAVSGSFSAWKKNTTQPGAGQPLHMHMRPWFSGYPHGAVNVRPSLLGEVENFLWVPLIPCVACNHGAQDAVPPIVSFLTHWPFVESTGTCVFVFSSNCD